MSEVGGRAKKERKFNIVGHIFQSKSHDIPEK